ncbi:OmpH family outer membrane protein, partial [bacterium]|nr:OmpH family outer membrane protein [bacterium]
MQGSIRIALCSFFLSLSVLTAQAAEQPAVSPAQPPAQPSLLTPAPGLTLLPEAKEPKQSVASAKIGVVDINKVSSESNIGKSAQAQIKGLQAKLQKQVEGKKHQIEKFKSDIERQMPGLTPPQREAKSKEFQKKVAEFQKFGMKAEKELMATQEKLTKELFEAIG